MLFVGQGPLLQLAAPKVEGQPTFVAGVLLEASTNCSGAEQWKAEPAGIVDTPGANVVEVDADSDDGRQRQLLQPPPLLQRHVVLASSKLLELMKM